MAIGIGGSNDIATRMSMLKDKNITPKQRQILSEELKRLYGMDSFLTPKGEVIFKPTKKIGYQDILDKNRQMTKNYLQPISKLAYESIGKLKPEYQKMTDDPAGFLEKIMSGYEPSRAYQLQRDEMLKAAGNTASAGGYRGTESDIKNQLGITNQLYGQDMDSYLQKVLGIRQSGLQGYENLFNRGLGATNSLLNDMSAMNSNEAQRIYNEEMQRTANRKARQSALLGLGSTLLGGLAGSAFGPIGTAIGSGLANKISGSFAESGISGSSMPSSYSLNPMASTIPSRFSLYGG